MARKMDIRIVSKDIKVNPRSGQPEMTVVMVLPILELFDEELKHRDFDSRLGERMVELLSVDDVG